MITEKQSLFYLYYIFGPKSSLLSKTELLTSDYYSQLVLSVPLVTQVQSLISIHTVLITSISPNGIGTALAGALAAQQPGLLILASRTLPQIRAVTKPIRSSYPDVRIEEVVIGLASLESVRRAARQILTIPDGVGRGLDVLFNNADINVQNRKSFNKWNRSED